MDIENAQSPGVSGGDEIRCDGPDLNHFRPHYFTRMVWQATDTGSMTSANERAREHFERDGREIVNFTVGGGLEVFRPSTLEREPH